MCVATALSMSPEVLTEGTDSAAVTGGDFDAEFIVTLIQAHGALVGENAQLVAELAAAQLKIKQIEEEQQRLNEHATDLQLSLERERRSRSTADSEKRAAEVREGELARQVSSLKTERARLMVDLDAFRRQVLIVRENDAKAAEIANRNYAVAKDFEQKLSTAKGIATVASLLGLAMVAGNAFIDDAPATRSVHRRRRA